MDLQSLLCGALYSWQQSQEETPFPTSSFMPTQNKTFIYRPQCFSHGPGLGTRLSRDSCSAGHWSTIYALQITDAADLSLLQILKCSGAVFCWHKRSPRYALKWTFTTAVFRWNHSVPNPYRPFLSLPRGGHPGSLEDPWWWWWGCTPGSSTVG